MIGNGYWSTGITVQWMESGNRWAASAKFFDDGFCDDGEHVSTEGTIRTRYSVGGGERGLRTAIDTVKADAERLGITFHQLSTGRPTVYYKDDGENPKWPAPPGWREIVNAQARRLGWWPMYQAEQTTAGS